MICHILSRCSSATVLTSNSHVCQRNEFDSKIDKSEMNQRNWMLSDRNLS